MRKLKSLDNFRVGKAVVVENGVERPATDADIQPVRDAFFTALDQGNVTVNGKPVKN